MPVAGATAAVSFWEGRFQHRPTRVPVLEGKGIPVGPVGPGHIGVSGRVAARADVRVEVLAEANPVVSRLAVAGNAPCVTRGQNHQIFETYLTECKTLQSELYTFPF